MLDKCPKKDTKGECGPGEFQVGFPCVLDEGSSEDSIVVRTPFRDYVEEFVCKNGKWRYKDNGPWLAGFTLWC